MPNIWVLCETWKSLANILWLKWEYYIIFIYFIYFIIFFIRTSQTKNEIITYNGKIILWWNLNENGLRFYNTFMIKLKPHWNWNEKKTKTMQFPYNFYHQLYFIHVATLALGSQPRQRLIKVQAKSEA
jgi:hypothetical protein